MHRTMVMRRTHVPAFPSLEIERLFDWSPREDRGAWSPRSDVIEDAEGYTVTLDVPGLKASEIEVALDKGELRISGERAEVSTAEGERIHRMERRTGRFSRTLGFPVSVDASGVEASLTDGVLRVRVPKAAESRPHTVEVKPTIEG